MSAAAARRRAAWVQGLLAVFVVALALAARAYPGGNWGDLDAHGHDLWRNYWCDLMREHAVNGAPSPVSAAWAKLAFYALGAALLLFWPLATRFVPGPLARAVVLWVGRAGAVGVLLVPVFTYDDFREAHAVTATLAGAFSLVAIVTSLVASWSAGCGAGPRLWGVLLALVVAVNIALYVPLALAGGGHDARLPVAQKVGTVVALGWLAATSRAAARHGGARSHA